MIAVFGKTLVIRVKLSAVIFLVVVLGFTAISALVAGLTFFLPRTYWQLSIETARNRALIQQARAENEALTRQAAMVSANCKLPLGGK